MAQDKSAPEITKDEQYCAEKTYIEDKIEFLFIDMEWNQKFGTRNLEGKEPIQIGLLGADACLEDTKLFSKGIRLVDVNTLTEETCRITHASGDTIMRANSLEEVFKRVKMSFPKFKYIVVWTKDTYDIFICSAKQAGIKMPRHRVLVLQDIIGLIATSGKKKTITRGEMYCILDNEMIKIGIKIAVQCTNFRIFKGEDYYEQQ